MSYLDDYEDWELEKAVNSFIDLIDDYIHDLNSYFHSKWEREMRQEDLEDC